MSFLTDEFEIIAILLHFTSLLTFVTLPFLIVYWIVILSQMKKKTTRFLHICAKNFSVCFIIFKFHAPPHRIHFMVLFFCESLTLVLTFG